MLAKKRKCRVGCTVAEPIHYKPAYFIEPFDESPIPRALRVQSTRPFTLLTSCNKVFHLIDDCRGKAAIEAAITLPIIVLFLVGVTNLALMINEYTVLTRAVHEGVMVGVKLQGLEEGVAGPGHDAIHNRVLQTITTYAQAIGGYSVSNPVVQSSYDGAQQVVTVSAQADLGGFLGTLFPAVRLQGNGPYLR